MAKDLTKEASREGGNKLFRQIPSFFFFFLAFRKKQISGIAWSYSARKKAKQGEALHNSMPVDE